jgi:phosphoribosylglycinamide formyltransferase-1
MTESKAVTPRRVVVLASGSGTNLQVLIDDPSPSWSVVGVVTDRPAIRALQRAADAGISGVVVDWEGFNSRLEFTAAVCDAIDGMRPDLIVLAGFMRILDEAAIVRFPNKIINVHPSLLPAFPGAHAVRDALSYGVKVTGVTVHFVDEHLDHGPIIRQQPVPVLAGDDEGSLHARIQVEEHRLLPEVVTALTEDEFEIVGRTVKGKVTA